MVRRIKYCTICDRRFVSVANVSFCQHCKVLNPSIYPDENLKASLTTQTTNTNNKRQRVDETELIDLCEDQIIPDENVVIFNNDQCSEDAESEGEDEIHCTQVPLDELQEEQSSDNERVEGDQSLLERNIAQSKASSSTSSPHSVVVANTNNELAKDICFICGADLTALKRRLDHIKRCSKKHGITGRDVRLNNDYEEFVAHTVNGPSSTSNAFNPYSKENNVWHGDASETLQLVSTTNSHTSASSIKTTKKQTSLTNFFQAPIRNLNSVLLAGAKRISKVAEVTSNNVTKTKQLQKGPFNRSKRNHSKKACPTYKKISGTDFVVDGFHYANCADTKNFFLTHFHSDHYGGITRAWSAGVIYCSEATATLVTQQLGVNKQYIHPLPMFTPTVIASKRKPVTVTLVDANHCPGAIMFLFEVGKKKVLHVGDFRWHRDVMMAQAPLRALRKSTLDELYLDTTYCNPKYDLPSQDQAIKETISIFDQELKKTIKTLYLFGAYTIGKEKLYMNVASRFGMKVYVDSRRYRILSAFQWPKEKMKLLTTRKEEASIWVVPLGDINFKKIPEYLSDANNKPFSFPYKRVVGYRPTGWSMGGKPGSNIISTRRSGNHAVHSVPYSEHSSFPELLDCLECLRPHRIIPTVSVSKSDEQIKLLLSTLKQKQMKLPFGK